MNQQCKVCGEPAAGFHFGAFTCEGCKSFFGRSYNNLSSISECKNGGECVINKKNRTACKACRLRKCLLVGMSKSGSRYGRRSNWFKIHCLLQEQAQQQQNHHQQQQNLPSRPAAQNPSLQGLQSRSKEDSLMLGIDDYKNSTSPSISSPESHNSDSSIEVSERRAAYGLHPGFRPLHPHLATPDLSNLGKDMMGLPLGFPFGSMPMMPPSFLPPSMSMISPYLYASYPHNPSLVSHSLNPSISQNTPPSITDDCRSNNNNNNNNNRYAANHNVVEELPNKKRVYLDAVLKSQLLPAAKKARVSSPRFDDSLEQDSDRYENSSPDDCLPPQDTPIDLSMKTTSVIVTSEDSDDDNHEEDDVDLESDRGSPVVIRRPAPIDLTTRS